MSCGAREHGATASCEATSANGSITKTLPDFLEAGDWSVTCSVDGAVLTTVTVTVHVDIIDIEPPVLTIPGASLTVDANAMTGTATVDFLANGGFGGETITAVDNVDTAVEISCVPASGSTFDVLPVGQSHPVTCTATDDGPNTADGNEVNVSAEVSFELIVQDVTPPTIPMLPDPTQTDILVEATAASGATVNFDVSSSDVVDSAPILVCVPAPGSTFALGSTTVLCTATDFWGNESEGSFVVTVDDTTAPTLSGIPGDFDNVEATEVSGASVSWPSPTATDLVDGDVAVSCTPVSGSTFGLSSTTVTCSATDSNGNSTSDTFNVSVVDTTPPSIDVPDDITVDTVSPGGEAVDFSVTATDIFVITTSCLDQDGGTVASGDVFPVGLTTVTCTATDANDNEASGSFSIDVQEGIAIRLIVPKKTLKRGSTNPIDWMYLNPGSGALIDSGHLSPMVSWRGPYTSNNCAGSTSGSGNGDDAGSSDIRYSASSKTWQFSWKTPNIKGYFKLFITPTGEFDPDATGCVRLR